MVLSLANRQESTVSEINLIKKLVEHHWNPYFIEEKAAPTSRGFYNYISLRPLP